MMSLVLLTYLPPYVSQWWECGCGKVNCVLRKSVRPHKRMECQNKNGAHSTVSLGLRDIEITCLVVGRLLRGSRSIPAAGAAGPTVVSW